MKNRRFGLVGPRRLGLGTRITATVLLLCFIAEISLPGIALVSAYSPPSSTLCSGAKITTGSWFDFYLDEVQFYSDNNQPLGGTSLGCQNQYDVGGGRWINFDQSGWKIIDQTLPEDISVKVDYDGDGNEETIVAYRTVYTIAGMVMIYTDWEDYALFGEAPGKVTFRQDYSDIMVVDSAKTTTQEGDWSFSLFNGGLDVGKHLDPASFYVTAVSHPWLDGESTFGEVSPLGGGIGGGVITPWSWTSGTYSDSLPRDWRGMYQQYRTIRGTLKIKSKVSPQLDYPDIHVTSVLNGGEEVPTDGKLSYQGMSMAIGGKTFLPYVAEGEIGDINNDGYVDANDDDARPDSFTGGFFVPAGYDDSQVPDGEGGYINPWYPEDISNGREKTSDGDFVYEHWLYCGQGIVKQGEDFFAMGNRISLKNMQDQMSDEKAEEKATSSYTPGQSSFDLGEAQDGFDEYVESEMSYPSNQVQMSQGEEIDGYERISTIQVTGIGLDTQSITVFDEVEGASFKPITPNTYRDTYAYDDGGESEFLGADMVEFDQFFRQLQWGKSDEVFFTIDFKLKPRATVYWGQYPYNWVQAALDTTNGFWPWQQDAGSGWIQSGTGMLRVPIGYRIDNVWECRPFVQKVEMITMHKWQPNLGEGEGEWFDGAPVSLYESSTYNNIPQGQTTMEFQAVSRNVDLLSLVDGLINQYLYLIIFAIIITVAGSALAMVFKARQKAKKSKRRAGRRGRSSSTRRVGAISGDDPSTDVEIKSSMSKTMIGVASIIAITLCVIIFGAIGPYGAV